MITCEHCGKRILVSKESWEERVDYPANKRRYWHNKCGIEARRQARWERLLEACRGDEAQARNVMAGLRNAGVYIE